MILECFLLLYDDDDDGEKVTDLRTLLARWMEGDGVSPCLFMCRENV